VCLYCIIINLILWVSGLYLTVLGFSKLKILLLPKVKNIFRIKALKLFRIYFVYDWDCLLYHYNNKFKVYKVFDDYRSYIKNILKLYIPVCLFVLCILELSVSWSGGAVGLFIKYCLIIFFIWILVPIFFATYTWSLIKNYAKATRFTISNVSIKASVFILKFLITIVAILCLEMVLLFFKACYCAFKHCFQMVFMTSLAILTFFDEIIRMYIDVTIYLNLNSEEESFLKVSLFLMLITFVGIVTSSIFQKIYFETLKSEHGMIFLRKESKVFSLFFTIIVVILGFYLITSYENNYLDLNGSDQNPIRKVFKWENDSQYTGESQGDTFNIYISKAPLEYKKFTALLFFALGLLILSFVHYSASIIFISNAKQKKHSINLST